MKQFPEWTDRKNQQRFSVVPCLPDSPQLLIKGVMSTYWKLPWIFECDFTTDWNKETVDLATCPSTDGLRLPSSRFIERAPDAWL
jgi:hypothetical protein